MTTTRWTINTIKAAMRASGSHWFDPDAMRFFGTRCLPTIYQGQGGVFFVTSEQPPHGERQYTVRQFLPETNDIETIGELASLTRREAIGIAKAKAGPDAVPSTEEYRPVTILEQFVGEIRTHGKGELSEKSARTIARCLIMHAARHHKMMEDHCNGVDIYDADGEPCRPLANLRGLIEANASAAGAKGIKFSGDPRGCTVKLIWADGATNDWGGEGWCVPTSEADDDHE